MDLRHGPCPSCPPIWRAVRHPVRETRWCLQTLPSRPALPWPSHFPHAKCVWEACGGKLRCVVLCAWLRACLPACATWVSHLPHEPAPAGTQLNKGTSRPDANSNLPSALRNTEAPQRSSQMHLTRCAPLCCRLASGNSWPSNQKLMQFHGDYSPVMFQCLMHILPPCADRALLFPSIEDRRWPDVQAIFIHAVITLLFRRRNSISSNIRYSRLWACGNCCGASVNLPPMSKLES
jgi:hypothetical protein